MMLIAKYRTSRVSGNLETYDIFPITNLISILRMLDPGLIFLFTRSLLSLGKMPSDNIIKNKFM